MTYRTQIIEGQLKLAAENASRTYLDETLAALDEYDRSGAGFDGEVKEGTTWRMVLTKRIDEAQRALAGAQCRLDRARKELEDR